MENSILKEFMSIIFESREYNNSVACRKANQEISEELDKINKIIPKELYDKIETNILTTQTLSEECGFLYGFKCGILLMCECEAVM